MSKHDAIMNDLAKRHDVILPLLEGRPIHYLDVPFYGNVGDLLIMLGTLHFFKKNQLKIKRMAMYFNYSPSYAESNDVIVFQGGGNFGDIYGPFQAFRERVIAALSRNRIVILPQSLHFSSPEKFNACRDLLSRHPDLHICVRDHESFELAKQITPNVYLLPDMAHQLWPIQHTMEPVEKLLHLRRRDSEARESTTDFGDTFDWVDLIGKPWTFFLSQVAERSIYHAHRLGLNKPFANLEAQLWVGQARCFVHRAINLFSRYERVESDRLHAHILSCLLSIPNQISDNSYGKNGRYIRTWTSSSPIVILNVSSEA